MRTALLTTNRTGPRVCVAPAVPDAQCPTIQSQLAGAQGQVRTVLAEVARHPDFQPAWLGREPVVVDVGCPAPPTIADPRYNGRDPSGAPTRPAAPSPYRLFVFLALPEQLAAAFPGARNRPRLTPQEVSCRGDVCSTVTSALYLTPAELADRAVLARALTYGVGLQPVGEPPTDRRPLPDDPSRPRPGPGDERGRPRP